MPCEDYPCCGHGPAPHGDGGGCPDAEGRFRCVGCGALLSNGASSALCGRCQRRHAQAIDEGTDDFDYSMNY